MRLDQSQRLGCLLSATIQVATIGLQLFNPIFFSFFHKPHHQPPHRHISNFFGQSQYRWWIVASKVWTRRNYSGCNYSGCNYESSPPHCQITFCHIHNQVWPPFWFWPKFKCHFRFWPKPIRATELYWCIPMSKVRSTHGYAYLRNVRVSSCSGKHAYATGSVLLYNPLPTSSASNAARGGTRGGT